MLLLVALILGLLVGLASGGRMGNLASIRFHWPYFVLVVLVVKEAEALSPLNRVEGAQYVYAAALAALVAWSLWNLDRLPGVWLVAIGTVLNLIPVVANGGRMPVARALAAGGSHVLIERGSLGQYVLMGPNTNFNWLADWVAMPGPLRALLPEAYSPGDLVVALGIALVAFLATRRRAEIKGASDQTASRILSDPP